MAIGKYINTQYSSGIPLMSGDRIWAQDFGRDFWFQQDSIGLLASDLVGANKFIVSGGVASKGAGSLEISVTACVAYASYAVTIPNTYATIPPSVLAGEVTCKRISSDAITNEDFSGTINNDDASTNYVKLRYVEANGNTRNRAKASGSYSYEVMPSWEFVVDDVAPTNYDVELAKFITTGGAVPATLDTTSREYEMMPNKYSTPIGDFVALHPSVDASKVLDTNRYILCDSTGDTLQINYPDGTSTTLTRPDLSDSRFLMGSTALGTGGSATHTHTLSSIGSHTHPLSDNGQACLDNVLGSVTLSWRQVSSSYTRTANAAFPGVSGAVSNTSSSGMALTGNTDASTISGTSDATSTLPTYFKCIYYMRIR